MVRATVRVGIAVAIVGVGAAVGRAAGSRPSSDPFDEFGRRIAAYLQLHQQTEARLPPQDGSDAQQIREAHTAMAKAMRAARADAKVGDVITPEVGEVFRCRIAAALTRGGTSTRDLLAALSEERPYREIALRVNQPFVFVATTPSLILDELPPLPSELQYRLVGQDLVLVDIHSTLIVDILPIVLAIE
jgi:hypothetical protein